MTRVKSFICFLTLTACSAAPTPAKDTITFAELMDAHQAIMVGEVHGNAQMPAALSTLVKEASATGKQIVVALEYDRTWQADLDAYLSAPLVSGEVPLHTRRTGDGRTSAAMRMMLSDLKRLIKASSNLHVRAVDLPESEWRFGEDDTAEGLPPAPDWLPEEINLAKNHRDIEMGRAAVQACEQVSCDLLIYYAGSTHTRSKISDSQLLNVESGKITSFRAIPAGAIVARNMKATGLYLSHRGGVIEAITGNRTASPGLRKSTTPDFATEDGVIYRNMNPEAFHAYIMSVGELTSSSDPLTNHQPE